MSEEDDGGYFGRRDADSDYSRRYGSEDDFRGDYRGNDRGGYARSDSRGFGRERDDASRFASRGQQAGRGYEEDYDDRGRNYGGRDYGGRDYGDDYDDRGRHAGGRGPGQGRGWFGDSRGHAEAGRQRWQEDDRGGREQDDDGRFMSREQEDYRDDRGNRGGFRGGRERDDDGRFISRDEDDRGGQQSRGRGSDHRGWFGDPRGHAQAARLGWKHRDR